MDVMLTLSFAATDVTPAAMIVKVGFAYSPVFATCLLGWIVQLQWKGGNALDDITEGQSGDMFLEVFDVLF